MKYQIAFVALLSIVGCKDKDKTEKAKPASGGKIASCNMPSAGECREYNDDNLALGSDMVAKMCTPAIVKDSTFSMTACPTADLVSSCAKQDGKDYYYKTSFELDKAEKRCADAGGTYAKK